MIKADIKYGKLYKVDFSHNRLRAWKNVIVKCVRIIGDANFDEYIIDSGTAKTEWRTFQKGDSILLYPNSVVPLQISYEDGF